MERIFDPGILLFLFVFTAAAFVLGLIVGGIKRDDTGVILKRGGEAAILALLGGFIAHLFISVLLATGQDSPETGLLIGWGFFLWPGAVDTIAGLFGARVLTTPEALLWIAAGVGAFTGMMDGIWRIHDWTGTGVPKFVLDVTWGLAGSTNGVLFHLVNFIWARHADEPRHGAHRYESGFRFKSHFAVTQGAVMSNMGSNSPGSGLFAHEGTHVFQNRIFGPFFTLTYLGWMVIFFIPALIAGAIGKQVGTAIEKWCYFNNPWEVWAYRVGAGPRSRFGGDYLWSDGAVLGASIPFYVIVAGLAVMLMVPGLF
jgi:hypothetical protein